MLHIFRKAEYRLREAANSKSDWRLPQYIIHRSEAPL
jgi:hypothetical protein